MQQFVSSLTRLGMVARVDGDAFRASLAQQGADASTIIANAWHGQLITDLADTINGTIGSDTIQSFRGDYILKGSPGDDICLFNQGDGQDIIYKGCGNDISTLFGVVVTPKSVLVRRDATSLYLDYVVDDCRWHLATGCTAWIFPSKRWIDFCLTAMICRSGCLYLEAREIPGEDIGCYLNRIERLEFADGT